MRFLSGFRFRLVPFIATLVVMVIGAGLGQWQIGRAHQKQRIEAQQIARSKAPLLDARALKAATPVLATVGLEFRRLQLHGEFITDWVLYLDNRPYQGQAGLYVLMPFRVAGSGAVVMIARGWIARNVRDRTALPPLQTPAGMVDVEGQFRLAPGKVLQLGQPPTLRPGAIVQNLDLTELARISGLPLQPYLIEQTSALPDKLVRDWPLPSSGIARHFGYAFQWYALAATACLFFVVTGFKRKP